uniref:Uncharacterized protein n=1 Tax=Oryza sativa subsp. japonica TaxID=39947 RepID=Q7Y174_ORYSJ|nr:hypothetical protein [Oryza sativa Japonica Group]
MAAAAGKRTTGEASRGSGRARRASVWQAKQAGVAGRQGSTGIRVLIGVIPLLPQRLLVDVTVCSRRPGKRSRSMWISSRSGAGGRRHRSWVATGRQQLLPPLSFAATTLVYHRRSRLLPLHASPTPLGY